MSFTICPQKMGNWKSIRSFQRNRNRQFLKVLFFKVRPEIYYFSKMFSKVSEFLWKIFLIISLFNFTNGVDSEPHDTHGKDSEPLFTPEKDSEPQYTPKKDSEPHFTPEKDSEPHSEDINHNPSKFHSILYKELPFTKEKGNHTNSGIIKLFWNFWNLLQLNPKWAIHRKNLSNVVLPFFQWVLCYFT